MARETDLFAPLFADALTLPPRQRKAARPTCRMHTAKGDRCTGEVLDADEKVIQICARHAAEVMRLINDKKAARR